MSKLVYAEPDDEITNLVDRLRSEKTEKELVFVLPAASRVMHSNLNGRLLMQYSNSLGKKTSVVSPDPRTQGVAIETGFDTYPSMAAFEAGHALDRAVAGRTAGSPIAAGALGAGAVADIPAVTSRRPAAVRGPVASPRPQPVAARPVATAPVAATAVAGGRRVGFLPWILAAVGIFLIAMIVVFFVLPTATVTITVAARPVTVAPTITGSTQPPADRLSVQTTLQQAQEQQQTQVPSTGQKIIPAVAAQVVVTVTNKNDFGIAFEKGQNYEVGTADGKKFHVVPATTIPVDSQSSVDITFTAAGGGVGGNVGPHAVTTLTNAPGSVTVDNKAAGSGGVDQQTKTVVAQADIDKTKNTLGATLAQKVKDDIKTKAGKDTVLADTQSIDPTISTDHQAGDEVPNFNATVTVKGKATTVNEDKLKAILKAALDAQVIAGYHLTDNPAKLAYTLVQHDENGGAVWNGTASGFQATAVNESELRGKVTGKSPKEAVAYVQSHLDAQSASVTIKPPFVPWLPFIANNIKFRTQVQNPTPG